MDRDRRIADEQFQLLVNSVVDYAIFLLDPTGRVVSWNPGAQRIKGYAATEIIGRHYSVFYPEEARRAGIPDRLLEQAAAEGSVKREGWRLRRDGTRFWADVVITALRGPDGGLRGYAKVTRDVTARHSELVQRALLAQAEKLANVGSWEWDPASGAFTWSDQLYRIYGLEPGALPPSFEAYLERLHPADRGQSARAVQAALVHGSSFLIDERVVRGNGEVRTVRSRGEAVKDELGQTLKVVCACQDVTQERSLARRLVEAEETERRRIARELHDRVGQSLSALNINLDLVQEGLRKDDPLQVRIEDALRLVENTLEAIENVMSELRPPLLDEYGLAAALGGFAEEFCRRTQIRVRVVEDDEASRGLPPAAVLALFRIGQEALNNVAKHSGARNVEVTISRSAGGVELAVSDDGCGFDADAAARRGRWGMTTMRERVQGVGGHFSTQSTPGDGTIVRAWVPMS
ncbi:MAG TPA: PAS domain S-box protein [Burkholderiales bacterium]|nr:PAS domain S-box protein [Burkholderiales bacterium]